MASVATLPYTNRHISSWFLVGLAVSIVFTQALILGLPMIGIDDANIFMTYGRNLSEGTGFVYNPGSEKVEGATSLLYTLVCAAAHATGHVEGGLYLFNAVCVVLIFQSCWRLLSHPVFARDRTSYEILGLYGFWLALQPGALFWLVLPLMDVALWALLLFWSLEQVLSAGDVQKTPSLWTEACLALAMVLTRPESLGVVPLLIVTTAGMRLNSGRSLREVIRLSLPVLVTFVAGVTALTLFRMAYFGYPLPNTYYAKVGSDALYNLFKGTTYLVRNIATSPVTVFVLLGNAVVVIDGLLTLRSRYSDSAGAPDARIASSPERRRRALFAYVVIVLWIVPALSGGDHFNLGRFLVVPTLLLPLAVISSVRLSWIESRGWTPRLVTILHVTFYFAAIGAGALSFLFAQSSASVAHEFRLAENGRQIGEALNRAFRDTSLPSVGEFVVGGIGYQYSGPTVDLLGLNNVRMAHASRERYGNKNHAAFDRRTFYELMPDLLLPRFVVDAPITNYWTMRDNPFFAEVLKGLDKDVEFRSRYEEVMLLPSKGDEWFTSESSFVLQVWRRVLARTRIGSPQVEPKAVRVYVRRELLPLLASSNISFSTIPISGQGT